MARPASFKGGRLAWIWPGYAWQETIDLTYSWKAYRARLPWAATQSLMNYVEAAGYIAYLGLLVLYAKERPVKGRARRDVPVWEKLWNGYTVGGEMGGIAVLLGFALAVMTLSKTIIYCKLT